VRVQVYCPSLEHSAEVDALVSRCPELVVHRTQKFLRWPAAHCDDLDDLWTISHVPTGHAVFCYFPCPEVALRIANILVHVPMDWPTVTTENATKRLYAQDERIREWFRSWDEFRSEWRKKKGLAATA